MQSWWSRRVAALAAAMLVAPLLAACGDGDDPADEGTPTPKFSEAPSSSAGSADASASASGSGSAEAAPQTPKQVARAIVRGVGDALNSGDPNMILKYSTDKCTNCSVVASNVEKAYVDGQYAETEGWRVESLKIDQRNKNIVYMSGSFRVGKEQFFRADGSLYREGKASTNDYQMRVEKIRGSWLVTGWNLPR